MNDLPSVSVIVPCRNEQKFIGPCLDSLIANDYPKDRIEILAVDGFSEDATRNVLQQYAQQYPFIRLLENPKKTFVAAVNTGVKQSASDIIMIVSAHSSCESDYVSKCVRFLTEYGADNVGGIMKTEPSSQTLVARSIALVLSHPFGAGNARFRVGARMPRWADTVYGGCYRKHVFEKVGLLNESLTRSADMDFNIRLRKEGGRILLVPDIVSHYYPASTLTSFIRRNFTDGLWATYPLKFGSPLFHFRHLVPFVFVSSLISSGVLGLFSKYFLWLFLLITGVYLSETVYFSARIAVRQRNIKYLLIMPVVFAARHIGYGLGSMWGAIKGKTSLPT